MFSALYYLCAYLTSIKYCDMSYEYDLVTRFLFIIVAIIIKTIIAVKQIDHLKLASKMKYLCAGNETMY